MFFVALLISLFSAILASSFDLGGSRNAAAGSTVILFGFMAYDFAYAALASTFEKNRLSWGHEFRRYLKFSLPLHAWLLAIILVVGFFGYSRDLTTLQTLVLIFVCQNIVISIFWFFSAWGFASKAGNRKPGESVAARFWRSSATRVAVNVASVFLGLIAMVLVNAGKQ